MLPPSPGLERVPLSDIADVLTETVRRSTGQSFAVSSTQGRDLAKALDLAGFVVVRAAKLGSRLTA